MENRFCSCGPLSAIPIYRRHPIFLFLKGSCYFNEMKGFAVLEHSFLPFWAFFARLFAPRYNARIQFLIAQTRILRSRIDASRIVPTPEEKAELLRWGAMFDNNIDGVMEVVKPATWRKRPEVIASGFACNTLQALAIQIGHRGKAKQGQSRGTDIGQPGSFYAGPARDRGPGGRHGPADLEHFYKDGRSKTKLSSWCRNTKNTSVGKKSKKSKKK